MDVIQGLNLINSVELVVIGLCCYEFTSAIKKSKLKTKNTYMPFISMAVGIFFGVVVALIFDDRDLAKAGLVGFLVGGFVSGLFTGLKGVTGGYEKNK